MVMCGGEGDDRQHDDDLEWMGVDGGGWGDRRREYLGTSAPRPSYREKCLGVGACSKGRDMVWTTDVSLQTRRYFVQCMSVSGINRFKVTITQYAWYAQF